MSNKIIHPGDATPMGNKYGVDISEVDPSAILAVLHKRIVGAESKIQQLSIHCSNLETEVLGLKQEKTNMKNNIDRCLDLVKKLEENL